MLVAAHLFVKAQGDLDVGGLLFAADIGRWILLVERIGPEVIGGHESEI